MDAGQPRTAKGHPLVGGAFAAGCQDLLPNQAAAASPFRRVVPKSRMTHPNWSLEITELSWRRSAMPMRLPDLTTPQTRGQIKRAFGPRRYHRRQANTVEHELAGDHFSQRTNPEVTMIKILEGFPDNVIAVSAIGRITRKDYDAVLIPQVAGDCQEASEDPVLLRNRRGFRRHGTRGGVGGLAGWGRGPGRGWERVAAVTDVAWIAHVVNAFRFLIPGQVRVFPTNDKEAARAWVEAP